MTLPQDEIARLKLYNSSPEDVPHSFVGPSGYGFNVEFPNALHDTGAVAQWVADTADIIEGDKNAVNLAAGAVSANTLATQGFRDQAAGAAASSGAVLDQMQGLAGDIGSGPATSLLYPALDKVLKTATDIKAVAIGTLAGAELRAMRRHEQGTSWYKEALNTATRGARRRFPRRYGVVAQAATATIYDLTDLDGAGVPRMWMVFSGSTSNQAVIGNGGAASLACAAALGSQIFVGVAGAGSGGLSRIDFLADVAQHTTEFNSASAWRGISGRNAAPQGVAPSPQIVSRTVNAVAARVLPGAPTDVYGRKIPTIAVATDAGASVIHPDGRVFDITGGAYASCAIDGRNRLRLGRTNGVQEFGPLPYADSAFGSWRTGRFDGLTVPKGLTLGGSIKTSESAYGSNIGLTIPSIEPMLDTSMAAHITKDYATGWMVGDCKLAICCDGATGNLVGGTVLDRSVNTNDLTVTGTLTRTALAGGDAVAYGGFSAENYLERAYDADFDMGAGDFLINGWFDIAAGFAVNIDRVIDTDNLYRAIISSTQITLHLRIGGVNNIVTATAGYGGLTHVVMLRRGTTTEIWINGALAASGSSSFTLTFASGALRVYGSGGASAVKVALLRIGKTAPTPAQIGKIHRDEFFRLQGFGLLAGTSNDVRALAEDETTGKLAVGTGDGVSMFHGLRRIEYFDTTSSSLTNDAMVAVAAGADTLLVAGGAQAIVKRDSVVGLDETPDARAVVGQIFSGVSTSATPVTLAPRLHLAEGKTRAVRGRLVGVEYGTGAEKFACLLDTTASRASGGNVTVHIAGASQQSSLYKSTASMDGVLVADTATQTLAVQATGLAGKTIAWTFELLSPTDAETRHGN